MNARNEKLTYTAIPSDERKPYWNVFVGPYQVALDCQKADAKFIADAFNMRGETGLTPRQLADQRAELLAVCQQIFKVAKNIESDGYMDDDARPVYEALRAAIASATGEQP